ncbi:MAG: alcohol dehydrogenase catalytic domain-containing protein [Opitutales bacterium]|nr:alcohol dehydrogenase catalytic domain-containing protein [Opitutales bacterium]
MKAFRRHAKEPRAARLEEVNVPEPGENEVLLRVSNCGICGSDLHAWLNHPGYEFVLEKVTFGHELSGIVEKVGPSVADWEIGDHAVMIALQTHHDDEDPYCRQGLPQLSARRRVQGLHLDGGMAEFVAVDTEFLIPVPEGLDMRLAALTEPLSVAEHCVGSRSNIGQDDKVLVTGPGIIGAFCAISARHRGADVVIAGTERDEKARLSALRSIGFPTLTVGPDLPPLHEQVKDHFGEEADAHIEASGASPVLADAWQSLKMNGIVTVVALYGSKVDFDVTQFVRRQIDVRVTYASSKPDYLSALDLLQQGAVDLDALVSFYPLAEAEQGFLHGEAQEVLKPMLVCN